MALAVSPNAPLYGHKNQSVVSAMVALPVGTEGNTARGPAAEHMTREDFDAKFPRFEKKVYQVRNGCTGCMFCGCYKSELVFDERELGYNYCLCGMPARQRFRADSLAYMFDCPALQQWPGSLPGLARSLIGAAQCFAILS